MLLHRKLKTSQQGAVLIVGLVMMLLMTILGLAAIRGSDLQERMAGNMRDRNLAFQSAEAGVRAGEEILDGTTITKYDGTILGYYPDLNKPAAIKPRPAAWTSAEWVANALIVSGMNLPGVSEQPRFAVERVVIAPSAQDEGSGADFASQQTLEDGEFFRVTSRGLGGTTTSEVVIQTTFKR